MHHSSTTMQAIIKHRRKLEDAMLATNSEIRHGVTLMFAKDSTRSGSDRRPATQNVLTLFSDKSCKWNESEALQSGCIGPLPLIRVSDMQGYDQETGARPSAGARLEQMLLYT